MHIPALIGGILCCACVGLDAFQTIILTRRPTGRFSLTRFFFIATWNPWASMAQLIPNKRLRDQVYSVFGPLSLLMLLVLWGLLLVVGFALLFYAFGSPFTDVMGVQSASGLSRFRRDLYVSGTTLFTLGLGDVLPHSAATRLLIILEAGVGLGFIALVIGYLPVFYQAFSRREVNIALLDTRAGSPPAASELLRRHGFEGGQEALATLLAEWERWSAEVLESHISYPILCYYRSQHDNQSWLSALVAILDTCALLISVVEGPSSRQAQLTFVMARHALIDLGQAFHVQEYEGWERLIAQDRLPQEEFNKLCEAMGNVGLRLCGDTKSEERLRTIRALYEPYAWGLSDYLRMPLPMWVAEKKKDQWGLLTKLHAEAEAALGGISNEKVRAASAHLHYEDH